jgi:hypothetical protein
MNEMALAADELAEKSKMELYNQQKLERRAAHAPSKEEIKHRITEVYMYIYICIYIYVCVHIYPYTVI